VSYEDDKGVLVALPSGRDIKVIYEVEAGGVLRKTLWGALTGGGLASIASSLLGRDKNTVTNALAGATAGGAYGFIDEFNTETYDETAFSKLLAHAIKSVEEELREIKIGRGNRINKRGS